MMSTRKNEKPLNKNLRTSLPLFSPNDLKLSMVLLNLNGLHPNPLKEKRKKKPKLKAKMKEKKKLRSMKALREFLNFGS